MVIELAIISFSYHCSDLQGVAGTDIFYSISCAVNFVVENDKIYCTRNKKTFAAQGRRFTEKVMSHG